MKTKINRGVASQSANRLKRGLCAWHFSEWPAGRFPHVRAASSVVGIDCALCAKPVVNAISSVSGVKNIRLDWRNQADEDAARVTARAFVRERVDLIVAFEAQAVRATQTRLPGSLSAPGMHDGAGDPPARRPSTPAACS